MFAIKIFKGTFGLIRTVPLAATAEVYSWTRMYGCRKAVAAEGDCTDIHICESAGRMVLSTTWTISDGRESGRSQSWYGHQAAVAAINCTRTVPKSAMFL